MRRDALISSCGQYRFRLDRCWEIGRPWATFLMLNPSTADAEVDDPTIRRCIAFCRSWGLGGLTVVNLYPYRSSDPRACREWAGRAGGNRSASQALESNLRCIQVAGGAVSRIFIAAWGAGAWDRDHVRLAADLVAAPILCLGETREGAPKHPLARGRHRIPDEVQPQPWSGP